MCHLLSCVAFFLIYESFITPKNKQKITLTIWKKRLIEKISKQPICYRTKKNNILNREIKKKPDKLRVGIELLLERNLCCVFIIIIVYVEIIIHSAIFCWIRILFAMNFLLLFCVIDFSKLVVAVRKGYQNDWDCLLSKLWIIFFVPF